MNATLAPTRRRPRLTSGRPSKQENGKGSKRGWEGKRAGGQSKQAKSTTRSDLCEEEFPELAAEQEVLSRKSELFLEQAGRAQEVL